MVVEADDPPSAERKRWSAFGNPSSFRPDSRSITEWHDDCFILWKQDEIFVYSLRAVSNIQISLSCTEPLKDGVRQCGWNVQAEELD